MLALGYAHGLVGGQALSGRRTEASGAVAMSIIRDSSTRRHVSLRDPFKNLTITACPDGHLPCLAVPEFAQALLTTVKMANSVAGWLARIFEVAFVNPPGVWVELAPNIAFQHRLLSQRRASVARTPLVEAVRKKKSRHDAKLKSKYRMPS